MNTLSQIAEAQNVQVASLKKKLSRNEKPSKFAPDEILPSGIIEFLTQSNGNGAPLSVPPKSVPSQPKVRKTRQKALKRPDLQERLSNDWLILVVLFVILWADMFAFGAIGQQNFSDRLSFAAFFFALIGLATGVGSVVTYNRIQETKTAEAWKWIFGILQFTVFALVVNEAWFWAELIMTSMFVLVFIGVQRSIKK